jgi:hypothetical protein
MVRVRVVKEVGFPGWVAPSPAVPARHPSRKIPAGNLKIAICSRRCSAQRRIGAIAQHAARTESHLRRASAYQNLKMRSSSGIAMLKPRDCRLVAHALERSHDRNQIILLSEAQLEVPENQGLDQVLWEIDDKPHCGFRSGVARYPRLRYGRLRFRCTRSVHARGSALRTASMVRVPAVSAASPQRRRADQKAMRQRTEQKRCRVPPRRGVKRFVHQGQSTVVSSPAVGLAVAVRFVLVTGFGSINDCTAWRNCTAACSERDKVFHGPLRHSSPLMKDLTGNAVQSG